MCSAGQCCKIVSAVLCRAGLYSAVKFSVQDGHQKLAAGMWQVTVDFSHFKRHEITRISENSKMSCIKGFSYGWPLTDHRLAGGHAVISKGLGPCLALWNILYRSVQH